MRLLILLTIFLPMTAQAVDLSYVFKKGPWQWDDYAITAASSLVFIADWGQTRWMSKHWDCKEGQYCYKEGNSYLGPYPSTKRVDQYFLTLGTIHLGINLFGSKYTRYIENVSVFLVHGRAVAHNYSVGVGIDF